MATAGRTRGSEGPVGTGLGIAIAYGQGSRIVTVLVPPRLPRLSGWRWRRWERRYLFRSGRMRLSSTPRVWLLQEESSEQCSTIASGERQRSGYAPEAWPLLGA
eukprot:scaffold244_cov416-Prasinococcus_capsulatus_cf.AAC.10